MFTITRSGLQTTSSWSSPTLTLGFFSHCSQPPSPSTRFMLWGNKLHSVLDLESEIVQLLSSGFLLAYTFFEKQKKKPSKQLVIDVIKGVVYRYIRIAPCFMIVSHKIPNLLCFNQKFTIDTLAHVIRCDAVDISQRHLAISDDWKHWGELQELLVAKFAIHPEFISTPRDGLKSTFVKT